jgi:hypothetical protein
VHRNRNHLKLNNFNLKTLMAITRTASLYLNGVDPSQPVFLSPDSNVLARGIAGTSGDKFTLSLFWVTATGSSPTYDLPAVGDTIIFAAKKRPSDTDLVFLTTTWTRESTHLEGTLDLGVADSFWDSPAQAQKTITANVEVRNAGNTSRLTWSFALTLTRQVYGGETAPGTLVPYLDETAARGIFVAFDAAQTLTSEEQTQAIENLGLDGSVTSDGARFGASGDPYTLIGNQATLPSIQSWHKVSGEAVADITHLGALTLGCSDDPGPGGLDGSITLKDQTGATVVFLSAEAGVSSYFASGAISFLDTGLASFAGGWITMNADGGAKFATGDLTISSTGVLTLGVAGTRVGTAEFKNATSGAITLQPVAGALGTVTLSLPAATDTLVGKATTDTLTNKTMTGVTISGGALVISGNISAAAWTTNGVRIKGTPGTLTDTSSSGTVATAYTDVLGGNTIAASSATTFTNYVTQYVKDPVAGTNVTLTNKWACGGDSARFGTSNQVTISTGGVMTLTAAAVLGTPASGTLTNCTGLTVAGGGTGAVNAALARVNLGVSRMTQVSGGDASWVTATISGAVASNTYNQGSRLIQIAASTAGFGRAVFSNSNACNLLSGTRTQVDYSRSFRVVLRMLVGISLDATSAVTFMMASPATPGAHDLAEKGLALQFYGNGASAALVRVQAHNGSSATSSSTAAWTVGSDTFFDFELVWLTGVGLYLYVDGVLTCSLTTGLPTGLGTAASTAPAMLVQNPVGGASGAVGRLISLTYASIY